jgi:hypothetical protein
MGPVNLRIANPGDMFGLNSSNFLCYLRIQPGLFRVARAPIRHARAVTRHTHAELWRTHCCSAAAQAAYSLLTLHPCITQFDIWKQLSVRVDFTLLP